MGKRTELPQEDMEELYAKSNDTKVKLRLLTLLQLKAGKTIKEASGIFKVHRDTIRNWIKRSSSGLSGLANQPMTGRKPKLKKESEEAFKTAFKEASNKRVGGRLTGQDIREMLAKDFNAVYSLTGVYRLLKRLKLVWITSRSIHPKQDEARVGQKGTTTRLWAEKGTRRRVVKQQQFLFGYIFGAVCPKTGRTAALVLPEIVWT
jgi:transposase